MLLNATHRGTKVSWSARRHRSNSRRSGRFEFGSRCRDGCESWRCSTSASTVNCACDLVNLRVRDVCHGDRVAARAIVMQQKTERPVQFEITPATRETVEAWIKQFGLKPDGY